VLHDIFEVPFDEIAPIVDRSPDAARQLASRARRRVRQEHTVSDADVETQRGIAEAFVAAARDGDFEALLELLDPDVVLRVDRGPVPARVPREFRGAEAVASRAVAGARLARELRPALVNGAAGMVVLRDGEPVLVGGITVRNRRIVAMDMLADRKRLRELDLTALDD
jgi:RNA polymerase sigma-70 factor (ECF subfamily)